MDMNEPPTNGTNSSCFGCADIKIQQLGSLYLEILWLFNLWDCLLGSYYRLILDA